MKHQSITKQTAGAISAGTAMALVVTLVSCAVCAWLLSMEMIPESTASYYVPIVLIVSTFAGVKVAIARTQDMRLLMGVAASVGYVLVLLAITALFFDGMYQGVGVTALVSLSGGIGSAILGNRVKKGALSRKSKIKHW